jgi:transcriptional regulator with XRE-family HTH domain
MATTPISLEGSEREVVRCSYPECTLIQFKTVSGLCRRCHRPLEIEEPVRPGPVAVETHPVEPSSEAGLKVAGQVKEIRRARHMSQRQLAGRMLVPRTYISKIENGKAIPTLGSLDRLATALGVDVRQLVRDTRSQRDDEVASIFADPLLAEIAALLPQLDSMHRSLIYGAARDMATGHRRIA